MIVQDIAMEVIGSIENSVSSQLKKNSRLKEFTDLWKFADSYGNGLDIMRENTLLIKKEYLPEEINVQCRDLIIQRTGNGKGILEKLLMEAVAELQLSETVYNGTYKINLRQRKTNFTVEELLHLKQEIISAIKGELILYTYIDTIDRFPSAELSLSCGQFKILECDNKQIRDTIDAVVLKRDKAINKNWLVLVLSSMENDCDYFVYEESVKSTAWQSDFDKVFIFDFYKTEIVELK